MKKEIIVKCSRCKKEFSYYTSTFRPFCTKRCQDADLGMWLTESFSVTSDEPVNVADMEVDYDAE